MPVGYNSPYKTFVFGEINIPTENLTPRRKLKFDGLKVYTDREDLTEFLEKLEKSIKKDGVKRPLEVSWHLTPKRIDTLELNVGESRHYVAKKLGIKQLPCWLCIYIYKINSYNEKENLVMDKFVEGLKKILPFQGEKSGGFSGVVPTIPYNR